MKEREYIIPWPETDHRSGNPGVILYAGVMGFVLIREKGVATEVPSADNYDAIIVLGAQVKPDGSPSVQLSWRLERSV